MTNELFAAYSWIVDAGLPMGKEKAAILLHAAHEIENLKAERDRYRYALEKIAGSSGFEVRFEQQPRNIAMNALVPGGGKENE